MKPYRDMSDEEWQMVAPLLPELRPRLELRGRPLANTRAVLNGVLGGYPVIDVEVDIVYGSYHEVDSNELAFKMAAIFAMKDGFKQGKPILLEPIMKVENITPEEYQGDIIGDLNRRRARINSIEARGNLTIVHAEVPLAEMFGYATAIRSLSKGRSSYSMEPSHFEQVPQNLVSAILDQKETK